MLADSPSVSVCSGRAPLVSQWCPRWPSWAHYKPQHANIHLVTQQTCFIYTHTQIYIHTLRETVTCHITYVYDRQART